MSSENAILPTFPSPSPSPQQLSLASSINPPPQPQISVDASALKPTASTLSILPPSAGGPAYDEACETLLLNDDEVCWHMVWNVFERVESMELDKGLLSNLRDVRNVLTGEPLDSGCLFVKKALEERGYSAGGLSSSLKRLTGDVSKIRALLKALMQIGANLSQTREYRDIFEDLITKVLEPLEDLGLSPTEIQTFLICCYYVVRPLPGVNTSSSATPTSRSSLSVSESVSGSMRKVTADKGRRLGKDWLRFLLCCRMILFQLVKEA